ncbi:hypothetical protein K503DRAFT_706429 [Rhizopogon vinicolor AM-OR11-026]|uniref:C2H2-type domain-containing protein n=2 Tax=Rhizopogon TaxID=5375 RepID=A0A1J8Q542_9AGAM|nr:hypothetical protein K503DRAFT_706429 [Rhizopogon vinicolor AM-OR11-026]OJA16149.1 hypothetical protein AZE42_00041 [Rhizopogon vesiculosus]
MLGPSLPSVLKSRPATHDTATTPDQLKAGLARVTSPQETPIYICAFQDCNRLFPSRDRVMLHRKRDHSSEEDRDIITWNE